MMKLLKKACIVLLAVAVVVLPILFIIFYCNPVVCPEIQDCSYQKLLGSENVTDDPYYSEAEQKPDGSHLHALKTDCSAWYSELQANTFSAVPKSLAMAVIRAQNKENTIASFYGNCSSSDYKNATSFFEMRQLTITEQENRTYVIVEYKNTEHIWTPPAWFGGEPDEYDQSAKHKAHGFNYYCVFEAKNPVRPMASSFRVESQPDAVRDVLLANLKDKIPFLIAYEILCAAAGCVLWIFRIKRGHKE